MLDTAVKVAKSDNFFFQLHSFTYIHAKTHMWDIGANGRWTIDGRTDSCEDRQIDRRAVANVQLLCKSHKELIKTKEVMLMTM